ncbi:MAG: PH domain-containing protein [Oscillospiraceae bacterium]|nr:PH domain-containing protein [Oscillospiraceae bacterium]
MKLDIEHIWTDKKHTLFGLPLSFTRYILTEKKFITRKGFFSIEEDEFDLYRVIDKKLVLPMGQRIFGCGTIIINVKDNDTPVKEVKSVRAPREFMKLLDEAVEKARDRYNIRGRDMYAAGMPMPHHPDHGYDHDDLYDQDNDYDNER